MNETKLKRIFLIFVDHQLLVHIANAYFKYTIWCRDIYTSKLIQEMEETWWYTKKELEKMMMKEMKINEEERVQRCSEKGMNKRENEEEEEEEKSKPN